jgi:hypothetical protein
MVRWSWHGAPRGGQPCLPVMVMVRSSERWPTVSHMQALRPFRGLLVRHYVTRGPVSPSERFGRSTSCTQAQPGRGAAHKLCIGRSCGVSITSLQFHEGSFIGCQIGAKRCISACQIGPKCILLVSVNSGSASFTSLQFHELQSRLHRRKLPADIQFWNPPVLFFGFAARASPNGLADARLRKIQLAQPTHSPCLV